MRKNFFEISCAKCARVASSRPFYKKSKLINNPSSTIWNVTKFVFLLYVQVEVYQNILKLSCRSLTLTLHKASFKNKERSGTSLLASFSAWSLKKNISDAMFY